MDSVSDELSSQQNRSGTIIALVLVMIFLLFGGLASFASGPPGIAFGGIFFLFFIIIIIIVAAKAAIRAGPGVQRPYTQQTAFSPPPPPDTILVKCQYCGMSQPFKEKCVGCGAPLPRPSLS